MKLWQIIRSNWIRAINTGCEDGLPTLELIRIRVVNGTAVLLALIQLILIFLRLYMNDGVNLILLNGLIGLLIVPVLYFNNRKLYFAAKATIFCGGLSLITAISLTHALSGKGLNTEIILIACSIYCALLFDRAVKIISFLLVFLCYFLVMTIKMKTTTVFTVTHAGQLLDPIMAFLTVYILTSLYRLAYNKAQKTIEAKNEELNLQNKQIELQANRLKELNTQKDKLFSIISHDLRNPLNSLKGLLTMVEKNWVSENEFKQYIASLSKNMHTTSDLIDNLLVWSNSQMKGTVQQEEVFDLSELAKEAVHLAEVQASQKKVTINNQIIGTHLVNADKNMIALVIRNLLTNSVKFSHGNQTVTLSAINEGEMQRICVEDTGIGIPPQHLNSLFEFNSRSTSGTSSEKGTGLGLALCKEFIEKNGGSIWVESSEGHGSKFYFTVPAHAA